MMEFRFDNILLQIDPIDFRKGRKSLAAHVQMVLAENPFNKTLFIFCNKRRDAVKALYWDKTGFALWEKELEESKFPWPRSSLLKSLNISKTQLEWLLSGIDFQNLNPHKELNYLYIV